MAFFDYNNEIKRRQMELAEREQRLQNDPGRIFLKSMAQSAPKALFSALGNVGVNLATNAANYNLFGGKDRSEAQIRESEGRIAAIYPQLRQQFFDKNYKGAVPAMGQQQATQQAKDEIQKPPMPTRMPDMVDMGDGTVAVEVPTEGLTVEQIEQQDLTRDPSGKMYKIMDQKEANRVRFTYDEQVAAARGGGISQFVAPKDQLPTPESLKKPEQMPSASFLNYQGGDLTGGLVGSPYPPTSDELKKQAELNSLERRKWADLTAGQRKKRQELIKSQMTEDVKNSYNFIGLTSAEQLNAKKTAYLAKIEAEKDPVVRQLLFNAYESLPSESQRQESAKILSSGKGTRRVASVSIGEGSKFVVNYEKKTRAKIKDAAMDAQSYINVLDDVLADPKRASEHADARIERQRMLDKLQEFSKLPKDEIVSPIVLVEEGPNKGYLVVQAGEESDVGKVLIRGGTNEETAIENKYNEPGGRQRAVDSIKVDPEAQKMFVDKVEKYKSQGLSEADAGDKAAKEMIDAKTGTLRSSLKGSGGGTEKNPYQKIKDKEEGILDYALGIVVATPQVGKLTATELAYIEQKAGQLSVEQVKAFISGVAGMQPEKGINRAESYYNNNLKQ